jgi:ribose transport system permease protein
MDNTSAKNKRNFLKWFTDRWTAEPLFSTGIALLIMIFVQTLVLGFDYDSVGSWFTSWLNNWINILRNNAGIGIVSLGMTFVIISGGIDLAVGSTLVATGAVIMMLIDSGPRGILSGIGITGIPAFVIAVILGLIICTYLEQE